jgi:hypothetical protein
MEGPRSLRFRHQQRFVGCVADFADCLQARGCQHVPDAGRKSNAIDRRVVRQFWRGIDQISYASLWKAVENFDADYFAAGFSNEIDECCKLVLFVSEWLRLFIT